MKRLTQILALSLLLSLVLAGNALAEAEEGPAPEILPTAVLDALKTETTDVSASSTETPLGAATRPAPVFLAGSNAGGAGAAKTELINGESSGAPRTYVVLWDHWCCPQGGGCACHQWYGKVCDPLPTGCASKSPPGC